MAKDKITLAQKPGQKRVDRASASKAVAKRVAANRKAAEGGK